MSQTTNYTPVSVESPDGKILTGVGVTTDELQATIDRISRTEAEPANAPDGQAAAPDSATAATQPPKAPRGARRIDQLTGEREAEKRARETAERERDDLKARLAAYEASRPMPSQGVATPGVQSAPPGAPAPIPAAAPTVPAEPTIEQFATEADPYAAWQRALARYDRDQEFSQLDARIRQSIEADRASRTLQEQIRASTDRAKQVYADFDAVLASPIAQAPIWSPEKTQAIASHPESGHLRYQLAKQPDLALQLAREPNPVIFGMELAKLVPAPAVAPPASTAGAVQSIAPPPYQPVAAGSKTTVTPSAELAKKGFDYDKSGYRERRAAERGIHRMK